jgi:hypothetical protein
MSRGKNYKNKSEIKMTSRNIVVIMLLMILYTSEVVAER